MIFHLYHNHRSRVLCNGSLETRNVVGEDGREYKSTSIVLRTWDYNYSTLCNLLINYFSFRRDCDR